MGEEWLM
jgi:hypothetical protein